MKIPTIFKVEERGTGCRSLIDMSETGMHTMQIHYVVTRSVGYSPDYRCSFAALTFRQITFGQVPWEFGGVAP